MAKLMTLEEWRDVIYSDTYNPKLQTLQRWALGGKIYSPPEKHGRHYLVQPGAIYIIPADARLGDKIDDSRSTEPAVSEFMRKGKILRPGKCVHFCQIYSVKQ